MTVLSPPPVELPPRGNSEPSRSPIVAPKFPLKPALLEENSKKVGRGILKRIQRWERRSASPKERLEKIMMRIMMSDEELKYRMLRFVDAYPALKSSNAIAAHLEDYLNNPALSLGGPVKPLSRFARLVGKHRRFTAPLIAQASRIGIQIMGSQFIAGHDLRSVSKRLQKLEAAGFLFSLDLLGEFVASEKEADAFAKRYTEMVEGLEKLLGPIPSNIREHVQRTGPRVNVSIKLSSLTSKFDPLDIDGTADAVLSRLRPLIRAAMKRGAFINIDMEKYEYRDATLEIIKRLLTEKEFEGFSDLGTVIQAYLVDAPESAQEFIDWLRANGKTMTLRLVKGAYWDSEQIWARQKGWPVPVITNKRETDAQYERMTRQLLENHDVVRTAIASHNARSIAHAITLTKMLRVPKERFELQVLFGMAGPIAEALRTMGLPIRVYTPCGELIPGMAYLVRRILENTANDSFLKMRFADRVDEELLLADPKSNGRRPSRVG